MYESPRGAFQVERRHRVVPMVPRPCGFLLLQREEVDQRLQLVQAGVPPGLEPAISWVRFRRNPSHQFPSSPLASARLTFALAYRHRSPCFVTAT